MDGFLDVWDFFYRQNEVAYSQKISDAVLTSISVMGSMAAIGDSDGTVSMMSLCRPLWDQSLQPKEKEIMQTMFEREFRREKNLEVAKRQGEKKVGKADKAGKDKIAERLEAQLQDIENKFFEQFPVEDEQRFEKEVEAQPVEGKADAAEE